MQIARVDDAFLVCRGHLDATGSRNSEIEAFLTRYLVVLIYAAFEETIQELVLLRANKTGDPHMSSFAQSAASRLIRSIKVNELCGFLKRFSDDYKNVFHAKIVNTEAHQAYDTIISNRHDTTHGPGGMLTFDKLEKLYSDSTGILEAFAEALEINTT